MKILCFDTSSSALSVGFFELHKNKTDFKNLELLRPAKVTEYPSRCSDPPSVGGGPRRRSKDIPLLLRKSVTTETYERVPHSTALMAAVEKVLKKAKLSVDRVDCLGVGLGPGSFTGLRVGITTAKVLSFALKIPVVGVSSLQAIALGAPAWVGPRVVMVDAKKEKIYAAIYEGNKTLMKDSLLTFEELMSQIKKPALFLGDAVGKYADAIEETGARSFHQVVKEVAFFYPRAENIAKLSIEKIKNKKFTDPFYLKPKYLYPRDCNVTRK